MTNVKRVFSGWANFAQFCQNFQDSIKAHFATKSVDYLTALVKLGFLDEEALKDSSEPLEGKVEYCFDVDSEGRMAIYVIITITSTPSPLTLPAICLPVEVTQSLVNQAAKTVGVNFEQHSYDVWEDTLSFIMFMQEALLIWYQSEAFPDEEDIDAYLESQGLFFQLVAEGSFFLIQQNGETKCSIQETSLDVLNAVHMTLTY